MENGVKNFSVYVKTNVSSGLIYSNKAVFDDNEKTVEIKIIYDEILDDLIIKNDVYLSNELKSSSAIIFKNFAFSYGIEFLEKFIKFIDCEEDEEEDDEEEDIIEKEFIFKDFYFKRGPEEDFEIGKNYGNRMMKFCFTIVNYELLDEDDFEDIFFELAFGLKKFRDKLIRDKAVKIEESKDKNELISLELSSGKISVIEAEENDHIKKYLRFIVYEKEINCRDEEEDVNCDFYSTVLIPLNRINFSLSQEELKKNGIYGFITMTDDYYSVAYEDKEKFEEFIKNVKILAEAE